MRLIDKVFALTLCCVADAGAAAPVATPPHTPPQAIGNEANAQQLAHARDEGRAYQSAVAWERLGASWSDETRAGDLRIVAALSPGEGGWDLVGSTFRWTDPPPGASHLRVFASDGADGRSLPGAQVRVAFLDDAGRPLAEADLPAGLYPLTDAYGSDVVVPERATTLVVTVAPLKWRRHDPYNGDRFSEPTVGVLQLAGRRPAAGLKASERAESAPPDVRDAQNRALDDTVRAMWAQANAGAEQVVGSYRVDYAVEFAEAYWEMHPGRDGAAHFRYSIENERTTARNSHVEVAPRDAYNGNFLAGLKVTAVVVGPDGPVPPPLDEAGPGAPTESGEVPFMWHSWLYHYGENWRVPKAGVYSLRVHFDAPTARRYGRASGRRMATPVDVTFDGVTIETGAR